TADDNVRTGVSVTFTGGTDVSVNALIMTGTANTGRFDSATTEKLIVSSGGIANTVQQVYIVGTVSGQQAGIQVAEIQTGAGNTRELVVHNLNADLAIGSRISTTGGLTKSGTATLYLTNPANT